MIHALLWGIKSMSKCRYPDMQISPSYNTKLYLFALDIWTMCPRWRACTMYQCTSVPAWQCARAEARVARMVTRSGLVYTWYWSAGQRSLRLYTATSHYTTTSPVSEQPASGQHRLACDKHLHSLRHVFMFSCIVAVWCLAEHWRLSVRRLWRAW